MTSTAPASLAFGEPASPRFSIHETKQSCGRPAGFAPIPVEDLDLFSLFEAARWAGSAGEEQPWCYFVATKHAPEDFARLLSCLSPANQDWAQAAPVLVLSAVRQCRSQTDEANCAALQSLGLASAHLAIAARMRGLCVHQVIGIFPERVRELYQIPRSFMAWTAIAIGYSL